jgi:hypothetical protein
MKKIFIVCSFMLLSVISVYADNTKNLFVIERSKNANVVKYDAVLNAQGKIDEKKPIDAYWLLYAEKNGKREELSAFDKKAYGYQTTYNKEKGSFDFVLKAVKEKPMLLKLYKKVPKVVIKINDIDCFLEKVYIESEDGALGIPKVIFYQLFGKEVSTGKPQQQKILVK